MLVHRKMQWLQNCWSQDFQNLLFNWLIYSLMLLTIFYNMAGKVFYIARRLVRFKEEEQVCLVVCWSSLWAHLFMQSSSQNLVAYLNGAGCGKAGSSSWVDPVLPSRAAQKAIVWTVLPSPMSSARIPPIFWAYCRNKNCTPAKPQKITSKLDWMAGTRASVIAQEWWRAALSLLYQLLLQT